MKRKIAKGLMAASVLICCLFLVKEVFAGRFFRCTKQKRNRQAYRRVPSTACRFHRNRRM